MSKLPASVTKAIREAPNRLPDKLPAPYSKLGSARRAAVRERYVEAQGGRCYHCGGDLDVPPHPDIMSKPIDWSRFPPNFLGSPVHLHHDHATDLTLGAVHAYCNAVLWQYHGE